MPKASHFRWGVLLSHARVGEEHRCIPFNFFGNSLFFCARCLGMYPALAISCLLRPVETSLPSPIETGLALVAPTLGTIAWALEHSGLTFPKGLRFMSGLLLGSGIGWVLKRHLDEPWNSEVLTLSIIVVAILVAGLTARLLRSPGRDQLTRALEVDFEDLEKNSPRPSQNEVDPRAS